MTDARHSLLSLAILGKEESPQEMSSELSLHELAWGQYNCVCSELCLLCIVSRVTFSAECCISKHTLMFTRATVWFN